MEVDRLVDRFLTDLTFSEAAPRPPVPGEENELISNGGNSTRSTGSHRTQSSDKSTKSRSPAATPRRSNLDKTGGSLSCSNSKLDGDEDAPLGFEPEGSEQCANSPPYTENTTPPYKKWAENLGYLLEDGEGVKLYKHFLDQEHTASPLDFWFACRGLKLVQPTDKAKIQNLSKLIYKKYIKGDQLNLEREVKSGIADKLRLKQYGQSLFDEAQAHVENVMRRDTYPSFLNSDIYLQYVQNGGESPKSSHSTSGSNSVRPVSTGPLPSIHEEKELKHEDIVSTHKGLAATSSSTTLPLNPSTLATTQTIRHQRDIVRSLRHEGNPHGALFRTPAQPFHVTYAPVSERDSENTSDAHTTDDAMSHTDSSIDGRDGPYGGSRWKKKQKELRVRHIQANKHTGLSDQFIPRTERAPQGRNIAEKEPREFARLLCEKLEHVLAERKRDHHVKSLHLDGTDSESEKPSGPTAATSCRTAHNTTGGGGHETSMLLLSLVGRQDDDNAESILEEHCNRIWDISRGETPTGRFSPDQSLRAQMGGPSVSSVLHTSLNMSAVGGAYGSAATPSGGKHKKSRDLASHSMLSFDSGVSDVAESRLLHKHAHSSSFTCGVTGKLTYSSYHSQQHSQLFSNTILYDDRVRGGVGSSAGGKDGPAGGGGPGSAVSRGGGGAKRSTTLETLADSGYNETGTGHPVPPPRTPNPLDPATNKVLAWMTQNDKITSHTNAQYSTDGSDRGSSLKHSHKSGSSKKSGGHSSSATAAGAGSAGDKHAALSPSNSAYHRSAGLLPAQPISQDPSMPLLTPPHPTVQLEEARRRLQEEQHRSRSVSSSRLDDKMMPPPPVPARPPKGQHLANTSSTSAAHLDSSFIGLDDSTASHNRSAHHNTTDRPAARPESVVVGYYFCNDPIPYRTTVTNSHFTLAMFKALIAKKGSFKYFFKKASDEFETGIVYEEVAEDWQVLPLIDGKIIGKIEKVE